MKGVIYARYSSDSQREESIEGQLRACADFAEKNGMTVLRHYIDRAFSAVNSMYLYDDKILIAFNQTYCSSRMNTE